MILASRVSSRFTNFASHAIHLRIKRKRTGCGCYLFEKVLTTGNCDDSPSFHPILVQSSTFPFENFIYSPNAYDDLDYNYYCFMNTKYKIPLRDDSMTQKVIPLLSGEFCL